jgi:nuclear pore complex protein Nup188
MPPAQSSAYFPPLDKCLAGDDRLISWKTAYRALCDLDSAAENTTLETFLTDSGSVNFLSNALDPYLQPGAKTKADFETKTAPIHVSQCANGDYDLGELKKDALWLSEKVNVEELAALRVVILEWLQRAQDQLLTAVTNNGSAQITAQTDLSASTLVVSTSNFAASTNGAKKPIIDFSTEDVRRHRQLQLFLEEKTHILKISTELVNQVAARDLNITTCKWINDLADRVTADQCRTNDTTTHDAFLGSCIDTMDSLLDSLLDPSKCREIFKSDDAKAIMLEGATFTDIKSALRMLLANLFIFEGFAEHSTVFSWFKLMAKMKFFQNVIPSPALRSVEPLQALACIISVTMLRVPDAVVQLQESYSSMQGGSVQYPQLNAQSAYYMNEDCFKEINLILYNAAKEKIVVASPVIFAWSIITSHVRDIANQIRERREQQQEESSDGEAVSRRKASRRDSRDGFSTFERLYMDLQDFELEAEAREDPATFFARVSVDTTFSILPKLSEVISTAFGSEIEEATSFFGRTVLLGLVRQGMILVTYGAEVLEAVLTLLSPDVPGRSTKLDALHVAIFQADELFRSTISEEALARYPFELSPLLRLLIVLVQAPSKAEAGPTELVQMLENLPALTIMVTDDFRDYALEHEDENMNSMVLKDYIPLFASKQALAYGVEGLGRRALTMGTEGDETSNVLAIPAGAEGIVVKESRPLVFRLEHPHSGLEYLGLLLSTILPNSEFVTAPFDNVLTRSTAADIVTLTTAILKATLKQHQGVEESRYVLKRFSNSLPETMDMISVVADIFEMELLSHLDQSAQQGSLELLIACAEFLDKLTDISPERVWSLLARSSLLGLAGGATALAAVVAGTELQIGRFRFLGACACLFGHLIDDAIAGLIKRRAKINKATNRFDSPLSFQDATPERTMTAVINAYQSVIVDAWQNLGEWRFVSRSEKVGITKDIVEAFEKLLNSTYGVANASGENTISTLLRPAAKLLLDAFTTSSANGSALRSFEAVFSTGFVLSDDTLPIHVRQNVVSHIKAATQLLTTVVRTNRSVDATHQRTANISSQLLKLTAYLAFLQAADHSTKRSTSALLTELVMALNEGLESDPPSLLSQLSTEAGKNFLAVISQLDLPLKDLQTECAIWTFLSTVMSTKQQWFAIYLLTGALPKDRLKDHKASKGKSLLVYGLDQLSEIATMPPERAMVILKFVASAQSAWVWATNEVRFHPDFLKNSLNWLDTLQPPSRAPNVAEEILAANEHQMAAYLCDILAVNLHASREVGDKGVLKMVTQKLAFLRQHAGSVDAYNRSLHMNLAENFARKFSGCQVADFARTDANPAPFGRDYFYDKDLADRVLSHEMAWEGTGLNRRQRGFADEFTRANVNLSLVDAQRNLLKSWRVLATMLCENVGDEASLQEEIALTAARCLQANTTANLDVPGMDEVVSIRADMTFVIVSKLVGAKVESEAMKALLPATWDLVRSSPVDYDVATAAEDLRYYRTMLQILYLAIQPHAYMKVDRPAAPTTPRATNETTLDYLDPDVAACFVQIVAKVIAPGFRALCGNLHNSIDLATPADFALLTAILQALLSVRGIESVYPQISNIIASTSLARGALSLYSWADQLAELMGQDPVYGEVAIMFLLALSTVRPVAELMAVEGVLVQLSSANLSNYFRKIGGKGPFDEPRRTFSIWTEAFLPLCLNLLDAVGPAMAADVSAFLNEFPEQLRRAETSLENVAPSLRNPHAGAVTLGLVSEARSLCMIGLVLESDTLRGAADGINSADVPQLEFDYRKVKDDAAGLMRQKTSLASRIVAVGEREEVWKATDGGAGADNVLMGKVVHEIRELMDCFGG